MSLSQAGHTVGLNLASESCELPVGSWGTELAAAAAATTYIAQPAFCRIKVGQCAWQELGGEGSTLQAGCACKLGPSLEAQDCLAPAVVDSDHGQNVSFGSVAHLVTPCNCISSISIGPVCKCKMILHAHG